MSHDEKKSKIAQLKQRKMDIINEVKETQEQGESIQGEFNDIKDMVHKMIDMFHKGKFSTNVANRMAYNSETHFSESNIT